MDRIKKHQKLLLIPLILVLFVSLLICTTKYNAKKIDKYIVEKNIVYTPNTLSSKSHKDIVSIDIFDYWIFKLNDVQKKELLENLDNGNWSELNSLHWGKLENFINSEKEFEQIISNGQCYVCVYDDFNNNVVTFSDKTTYDTLTQTIIFVYEAKTNYYICIHSTM